MLRALLRGDLHDLRTALSGLLPLRGVVRGEAFDGAAPLGCIPHLQCFPLRLLMGGVGGPSTPAHLMPL